MHTLERNYRLVLERIEKACASCSRDPRTIRLLAVSKTHSAENIRALYDLGHRDFGENYVDELLLKAAQLQALRDIRWSFIGSLQSNKIQRLMSVAHEIQTVASEKHLRYLERYAGEAGRGMMPFWVEVNVAMEASKSGVARDDELLVHAAQPFANVQYQGLMVVPPFALAEMERNDLYHQLRKLASTQGRGLLSLGMSDDLEMAIAAGSDCVRVGTDIFGARPRP